jgi:hypothetical protein
MRTRKALAAALLACGIGTPYLFARPQFERRPQVVERIAPGSDCRPYDPADLTLIADAGGTWLLARGDGARLRFFANRSDADAGLAVFKQHSTLCYIGRDNTRPNRSEYIMEYLK